MSEPEESEVSRFFRQKLWPFRLPVIFFSLAILFLFLAFLNFIISRQDNRSIVISQLNDESASQSAIIKIDVSGAVNKPGVYALHLNDRIQEALISAGGLSTQADGEYVAKNINLAGKLIDGTKIYIPSTGESVKTSFSSNSPNSPNAQINLNNASLSDLDQLSGVGPVTAQKIIDNRPYQSIEELVSKKAVGQSVFEKIKDKITVY